MKKSLIVGFNVVFMMAAIYIIVKTVAMWWDAGNKLMTFGSLLVGIHMLVLEMQSHLLKYLIKKEDENEK